MRTLPHDHGVEIAVIAPSAPPAGAGGVAGAHYHLWRCLRRRGIAAALLTFNETALLPSESDLFRFGATPRQRQVLALCSALYLKAMGSRKPAYQLADILASVPGVLRLNRVLRRLRPARIIMPDHGAPGLFLDKGAAHLTLVTHHNPVRFIDNPLVGDFCPVDVRTALSLEQRVLGRVDAVVSPSRYMEGVFRDTFRFAGPVATIPTPLDLALIDGIETRDVRGDLGLPPEAPLVYIPSAGSRLKGERFVASLVARLAAARPGHPLGFYLSGGLSPELAGELCNVAGNVRIHAPGQLGYRENLAVVKGCSFALSPTLVENFSMALLEAVCCGLPAVAFRTGGTGELITDARNGFSLPCGDLDSLAAAAVRLLDSDYCRELGRSARLFSRGSFDPERLVDRYLGFCRPGVLPEGD